MLRIGCSSPDKLTVARVQFIHRRHSNFSRLIDLLMKLGKQKGLKILEIEGVHTPEMDNYVRRHNFKQKENQLFSNLEFTNSYNYN